ncbi:Cupin 1 [Dillenia turbinata]|uniref:Germin-like protein n=1 Tax=Dillenia turbinata TaxID=194707 RepID=A0AAN8USN3_9MAGN
MTPEKETFDSLSSIRYEVALIAKMTLACLQSSPEVRPTMRDVSRLLSAGLPPFARPFTMITMGELLGNGKSGLHIQGNTTNAIGSKVTLVFVAQLPPLYNLGISIACLDFAISGINILHAHPCAMEIFMVLGGSIKVGFVTSNPENDLITKVLKMGDVFVFPVGLSSLPMKCWNWKC